MTGDSNHNGPSRHVQGFPRSNRFDHLATIGSGGMGTVFLAFDRERETRVALKTLRLLSAGSLLRFKNEFRLLQDLHHPNLVSFGDLFETHGTWFFTMELVDGEDLLTHLRPHGKLDVSRLRTALAQLAAGLGALHEAGLVHRDIKPSNVLVGTDGRVVILDFGLMADLDHNLSLSNEALIGTADYMAPEQAASKPIGPAADWYSMGVLMYQALTGALPFTGAPLSILMVKQRQTPLPPRERASGVPEDLDELCTDLLRIAPSQRPSAEDIVRRLHAAPGSGASPSSASASSAGHARSVPFVGRRTEKNTLSAAFEHARSGRAVATLITGESGIGKTELAKSFCEEMAERWEAVTLTGRCYARESVPYKALDGVIDALSTYMRRLPRIEAAALVPKHAALLGRVFPVLRRADVMAEAPRDHHSSSAPVIMRAQVFSALRELLFRLAERHPVVLFIDDLQWADADSLALLAEVLRPAEEPPLLLIATVRTVDNPAVAGRSAEELADALPCELRHVPLDRLPPRDARLLAQMLIEQNHLEDKADPRAIANEAGGHPLFVQELVLDADRQSPASSPTLSLEDVLWARIQRLDATTRRVLEVIAIADSPLPQQVIAQTSRCELGDLARHASALRVANLVLTSGSRKQDEVEVYHDRVRAAVNEHLQADRRRELHRRIAVALEAMGRADPEALAAHWLASDEPEAAERYAAAAAEQATEALAFDQAARLYRLSLEHAPPGTPETRALLFKLGEVLTNAGRGAEAAAAFLQASKEAPTGEALELERRAAEQLLRSGHIDDGLQITHEVLETLGMPMPRTARRALTGLILRRAQLRLRGLSFRERDESQLSREELTRIDICWSVAAGLSMVDTIQGSYYQTHNLRLSLRAGEPYRVARALAVEAAYYGARGGGGGKRADKLLRAAQSIGERLAHPHVLGLTVLAQGVRSFLDGKWKESLDKVEEAARIFRGSCQGTWWEINAAEDFAIWCMYYLGHLRRLRTRAPALVAEADEHGDLFAATSRRTIALTLAKLAEDDPEGARAEVDRAMDAWYPHGFQIQDYYALWARQQIAIYAGDGEAAYRNISERWDILQRSLIPQVKLVRAAAADVRARSALCAAQHDADPGERNRLAAEAGADARTLLRMKMAWADGLAHLVAAQVASIRGQRDGCTGQLTNAALAFDRATMPLHAATSRWRRAALVGGSEGLAQARRAREHLVEAGIENPARFAAMLAPGFPPIES